MTGESIYDPCSFGNQFLRRNCIILVNNYKNLLRATIKNHQNNVYYQSNMYQNGKQLSTLFLSLAYYQNCVTLQIAAKT